MIQILFLTAPLLFSNVVGYVEDVTDEQVAARIESAGNDAAKLWEVAEWAKENERRDKAREIYKLILEIDPEHEGAHKGLRHHNYDGKWFESYAELSAYRRDQEKRMLEEHGLVRFGDDWVKPEDVPFLRMGWDKDADGNWVHKADVAREAQEAKYREEGWQRQADGVWVPPDEVAKWQEGLTKCGDQWLSIDDANKYHSEILQPRTYKDKYFVVNSTCDWGTVTQIAACADQIYPDLVRAYGVQPQEPPQIFVLNSIPQYNAFASGDQAAGLPPVEIDGYSSVHYAFFAELLIDPRTDPPKYRGSGVAYWDRSDPNLEPFGKLAIRHAAGQSYAEVIDPSWEAVSHWVSSQGQQQPQSKPFWDEKRIPRWFRYGTAAYVERYFEDKGAESPWWARLWSIDNLKNQGGLRPLEEVFAFQLDTNDQQGSSKLINESGLLVSFILDGGCAPVIEKHQAFKQALKSGEDTKPAVEALQQALVDNKTALYKYAGFEEKAN